METSIVAHFSTRKTPNVAQILSIRPVLVTSPSYLCTLVSIRLRIGVGNGSHSLQNCGQR